MEMNRVGRRKSARISKLVKRRNEALQKQASTRSLPPLAAARKKGSKGKNLQSMVVNLVAASAHQEEESDLLGSWTTFPVFLSPPYTNPYAGKTHSGFLSVSRDDRDFSSSHTQKRMTYLSPACFCNESVKTVSSIYDPPKFLTHVNHSGTPYKDSLMRFVQDLGPTAQNVANRKLKEYSINLANASYLNEEGSTTNTHPAASNETNNVQSWVQMLSKPLEKNYLPCQCNSKAITYYSEVEGPSRADPPAQHQIYNEPQSLNKPSQPQYLPFSGTSTATSFLYPNESPAVSSQVNNEHQLMQNKLSEPTFFSYSTSRKAMTFPYLVGVGSSTTSAALQPKYVADQAVLQSEEWKQLALWGLPPTSDFSVLQIHVNEQIPSIQQQSSELLPAQEVPLFNTMDFLEGANLKGCEINSTRKQFFWRGGGSLSMDSKDPDLNLQL